jgi:prepilin-type N-terminal cleavage/methylation domain-containing protein
MNLRAHPTSSRGFTLIEVMLAATVMLVGIVGMMHVVTSGAEMLDASRKQTIATQIMHGEIERVRLTDWTQITELATSHPAQQGYAEVSAGRVVQWLSTGAPMPENTFKVSRTIADVRSDLKQISYTVSWVGNTGRPYTRSTSTYVGRNGLYVAYQR